MDSVKLTIQGIEVEIREMVLDQVLDLLDLLADSEVKYTTSTSPVKFIKQLRKKELLKPALAIILIGDRVNEIEPAQIKAGEMGRLMGAFFTTNGEALGELVASLRHLMGNVKAALMMPSGRS